MLVAKFLDEPKREEQLQELKAFVVSVPRNSWCLFVIAIRSFLEIDLHKLTHLCFLSFSDFESQSIDLQKGICTNVLRFNPNLSDISRYF